MQIINNLSEDDLLRSMKIPHTPSLLAGAFLCLVEACDHFATATVNPLLHSLKGMDQRRTIFAGLHYRIQGFCKTVILLKNAAHQQSITSAERSVVELYVDMELLNKNVLTRNSAQPRRSAPRPRSSGCKAQSRYRRAM